MRELIAMRHGQSTANVAFPAADAEGRLDSGIPGTDAEVALTDVGRRQAAHLGWWLAELPAGQRPEVAYSSPYLRARDTWRTASAAAQAVGVALPAPALDDRLRDRLLGEWEMQTASAIHQRWPEQASQRLTTDQFEFRPPGGETFTDVADRLAAFVADLTARHPGQRVAVVAHDAVVLMLRKVLEGLSWVDIRGIVAQGPIGNASVTRWVDHGRGLALAEYNQMDHLR